MRRRVAVVGAGVLSCLGSDYRRQWQRILAAETGLRRRDDDSAPELGYFGAVDDAEHPIAATDRKHLKRLTRASRLGVFAADLAVADAGPVFRAAAAPRRGIYIGSNENEDEKNYLERFAPVLATARRSDGTLDYLQLGQAALRRAKPDFLLSGLPNAALCQITIRHEICGANSTLVDGSAMGLCAVGRAFRAVRDGRVDVAVCGGTDAGADEFARLALHEFGLTSACRDGVRSVRPYDLHRDGYVCAEGAAALVLADLDLARANDANVLAEIVGFGAATDRGRPLAPDPEGSGVRDAIARAIADADVDPRQVGYVYGHGDATADGDRSELRGIAETLARQRRTRLTGTKAATGHMGPATDVAESAFACLSIRDGVVPPTLNLGVPDNCAREVEIVDRPSALDAPYLLTLSRNVDGPEVAALVIGAA
ncbi:beta-ketoacyl-[acyl-carrier-protein] synthase family protein [Nocardia altamirensis]|uniref:beta-ketoacyl-[acyl-carrier-protein] synthase family protein n=1 Tax=Nocardia altamirensis TaxID=472158 RepID=UPI000A00D984|nr:beta-ketoacyl synthase N-terminal-like domain-containing protein [Nocardia altamirensis]